jgi:DNA-nicking Smr family endonuclease
LSHHAFVVNIDGERVEARRDDTEAVVLPWLERQDPTATLDLHGHQAEAARRQLHRFLRARSARRHRVVLVITGRGQQSGGVLRANTPEWLTEPSIGEVVRAFVSAPPSFGGAGALLVLLHTKPPT